MDTEFPGKEGQKVGEVTAVCVINKQEDRLHNRYPLCWVMLGKEWSWTERGERKRTNVHPQSQNMALIKAGSRQSKQAFMNKGKKVEVAHHQPAFS